MAKKQVMISELNRGAEFVDISAGSNAKGETFIVSYTSPFSMEVEANPTWDKEGSNTSFFKCDELVEIFVKD